MASNQNSDPGVARVRDSRAIFSGDFDAAAITRFRSKYRLSSERGCWLWNGTTNCAGYGMFYHGGRTYRAHRVAVALHCGEAYAGSVAMHACDTPRCVNPAHLKLGTIFENNRDMREKGRAARQLGESNGQSKLDIAAVQSIKSKIAEGRSLYEIAEWHGITYWAVSDIARGRRWRHVQVDAAASPAAAGKRLYRKRGDAAASATSAERIQLHFSMGGVHAQQDGGRGA